MPPTSREKIKERLKTQLEGHVQASASSQRSGRPLDGDLLAVPGRSEEERELRQQAREFEGGASSGGQGSFGELLALMTMMARLQLHEMKQRVIPPVKYQDNPMPSPETGEVPRWVLDAAGDPLLCDLPSKQRIGVHVRILPSLYQQVQRAQKKLKLRTVTGTLEYLLKIGLAVAEKGLPLNIDSE